VVASWSAGSATVLPLALAASKNVLISWVNAGQMPGPASDLAIEVDSVTVSFRGRKALDGVDLRVRSGEIFGVVGTNGAGKSTLIDVLSGMVRPSGGKARVLGMDPIKEAGRLRKVIGVVPQEMSLEERLSARENLVYFGRLLDMPGKEAAARAEKLIRFMGLWDRRDDLVERYSFGMKKKVHFACSLVHSPRLILVDEATAGFDPRTKREVGRFIVEMNEEEGTTVLLTTHDLSDARSMCDRLVVLHRGRVVAEGTWDEISAVSEAKLLIQGVGRGEKPRVEKAVSPRAVRDILGGFEIEVSSQDDGFQVARLLEKAGLTPSSISFEVPPEEMFEKLTEDLEGEGDG